MSDALSFVDVHKRYGRGVKALDGFTCRFPTGAICGLVGPNGAGKTTAFSVVSGFLQPDVGEVTVLGEPGFDPWRLKGRLGVLPQDAELGPRHTPRELLSHLGRLQGMKGRDARTEADRVLDVVRLSDRRSKRIGSLSHGMRRRVAVASAMLGDPDLVMLDEPTAGLDPVQARSLRQALTSRRDGQTILVSSHNLDELERICDWVVMMDAGRCIRQGSVAEVTGQSQVLVWALAGGAVPVEAIAASLAGSDVRLEGLELTVTGPPDGDLDTASIEVMRLLAEAGVAVREVRRGVGLERTFFEDSDVQEPVAH